MNKTFCNPINISYPYRKELGARELADPAVVIFKGEYYLFASHGFGYWVSGDLCDWEFIEVDIKKQPQFDLYAPATMVKDGFLYLSFGQGGHTLRSGEPRDPLSWEDIGSACFWNDPAFLLDNDGEVYAYEGLSPSLPLRAMKLDSDDLTRITEGPHEIFQSDPDVRGFERPGDLNDINGRKPYLEGAWVNRIGDKYYLTYAVPGTEFAGYCDGCAVSDAPMGPFTLCENSPIVYKATGFVRGAGHGCLFADLKGNYWKMDTVSIAMGHSFERRLCLFPATVGDDGLVYVNAYRGDYPMLRPHDTDTPFYKSDAGLHLLTLGKKYSASSVLDEGHAPDKAFDENIRTCFCAAGGGIGEWLEADLCSPKEVSSVQVNFADYGITPVHGRDLPYRYLLEGSLDGENWSVLCDKSENTLDLSHDHIELETPTMLRYVRLTNRGTTPANGKFAVSGLRVFGKGGGDIPDLPKKFTATRLDDRRDMLVKWEPSEGADGYFIRFGVKEDALYTHWQVVSGCEAVIHCLISELDYFVTVDAYNESGVAKGISTVKI